MRRRVTAADPAAVGELVAATGFFDSEESQIAVELVEEYLQRGEASGYRFVFADGDDGRLAGYACYGPIPATQSAFDLYWVAVAPEIQGRGLGRRLVEAAEQAARDEGGSAMYLDTAGREQYAPTRAFYEHNGYTPAAVLPDFYRPGDDKVIYRKPL